MKVDVIAISLSLPGCPLLKTRPGLLLAKTTAMLVMINTTGCPAPVSDRTRMKSLTQFSPDRSGRSIALFLHPNSAEGAVSTTASHCVFRPLVNL